MKTSPVPTLIPAVAYYRMSSDQQEASIRDQRIAVEEMAKQLGYVLLREYADEAISGWRDDRKGFQRLIADASRGDFQAVLCWDQDRFSRFDVLEANHYWFLLDRAGVHITTVGQGRLNFSDLAGWLTASINQHGKAQYCRDLARNTSRGLRKRKLAGEWVGSAPYGYTIGENGKLALGDQTQIAVVRQIFTLRSQGHGYVAICKVLNQQGTPTPRGCKWTQFSVKHILQRDAYLGATVIGKWSRAKYEKLTSEVVTITNNHPAIISQELWDKCLAVGKQNRKPHTRNGSSGAMLGGLAKCGCCGNAMYSVKFSNETQYICGRYHSQLECHRCAISQEKLNALVIAKITPLLDMERLACAIHHELGKVNEDSQSQIVEQQLVAIERKINNATDRLLTVSHSLVSAIESKLLELTKERDRLSDLKQSSREKVSAVDVLKEYRGLAASIQNSDPGEVRRALSAIINEVRINFSLWKTSPSGKQRWRPTGGHIEFTKQEPPSEMWSPLCNFALALFPRRIRLTASELAA